MLIVMKVSPTDRLSLLIPQGASAACAGGLFDRLSVGDRPNCLPNATVPASFPAPITPPSRLNGIAVRIEYCEAVELPSEIWPPNPGVFEFPEGSELIPNAPNLEKIVEEVWLIWRTLILLIGKLRPVFVPIPIHCLFRHPRSLYYPVPIYVGCSEYRVLRGNLGPADDCV